MLIRHMSKAEDVVGLKKIEEKDKQFSMEKLIHSIKKESSYKIRTEKKQKLFWRLKKTTEYVGVSPIFVCRHS